MLLLEYVVTDTRAVTEVCSNSADTHTITPVGSNSADTHSFTLVCSNRYLLLLQYLVTDTRAVTGGGRASIPSAAVGSGPEPDLGAS